MNQIKAAADTKTAPVNDSCSDDLVLKGQRTFAAAAVTGVWAVVRRSRTAATELLPKSQ